MNISQSLSSAMQYIFAAVARIFSPSDDAYPMVGVQPFDGDPYEGSQWME
ncbi:hypothetical protein [Microcoleus sp. FACHB-672]|nr:hypothetical protein [Microcoleus sp. FACHB-672]MBD2039160.1 hypothetical protein [Microcoleus sp. FACHB-672]